MAISFPALHNCNESIISRNKIKESQIDFEIRVFTNTSLALPVVKFVMYTVQRKGGLLLPEAGGEIREAVVARRALHRMREPISS